MENVTAKSYTIETEAGSWLGQVILTNDGFYSSVTDYGNFSYVWRHRGEKDIRKFIIGLEVDYFAAKMYQGISYVAHGKSIDKACARYAEMILPALKRVLQKELDEEAKNPPVDEYRKGYEDGAKEASDDILSKV